MNYLSHARRFLDRPYFVAGVAIPDWLSAVDRKVRVRSKGALQYLRTNATNLELQIDPLEATPQVEIAKGIVQHIHDDKWFHLSESFVVLNARLSKSLRDRFDHQDSLKTNFFAHVAIELLMDACLVDQTPDLVNAYYQLIRNLDLEIIEEVVESISQKPLRGRLADFIQRFLDERFLADYQDDTSLLRRLNNVMSRVKLDAFPSSVVHWLADARSEVRRCLPELFAGESEPLAWLAMNPPTVE